MVREWTSEKIGLLSDDELMTLSENAARKNNTKLADFCRSELTRRYGDARRPNTSVRSRSAFSNHSSSKLRQIELDADAQLVDFTVRLDAEFDLSPERALALSTVKFRPLRLLSKNGRLSKTGGIQLRGTVAICRYISYKKDKAVVGLAAVMIGKDDNRVVWRVSGPDSLLPNQVDRYPSLEIGRGVWFESFHQGAALFRELLLLLDSPRRLSEQ